MNETNDICIYCDGAFPEEDLYRGSLGKKGLPPICIGCRIDGIEKEIRKKCNGFAAKDVLDALKGKKESCESHSAEKVIDALRYLSAQRATREPRPPIHHASADRFIREWYGDKDL